MRTARIPLACWAALAVLGLLAGCQGSKNLVDLQGGWPAFQRYVLAADKPVMIEFYKDNCPTCVVREQELDPIALDYQGRVYFYKMKIEDPFFQVVNKELVDRYKLYWVPTVSLFVKGQEKKRWALNVDPASEFRKALVEVVGPPMQAAQASPVSTGPPPNAAFPPPGM